jgi:hypothetical protein
MFMTPIYGLSSAPKMNESPLSKLLSQHLECSLRIVSAPSETDLTSKLWPGLGISEKGFGARSTAYKENTEEYEPTYAKRKWSSPVRFVER